MGLLGLVGHVGLLFSLMLLLLLASCARMGRPDGGWYDETPPSVVGASPADINEFADILDRSLQDIIADSEAKRFHDLALQHLEIVVARPGQFDDWLRSKGKLGGQHKIPRLSNNRQYIEEIMNTPASGI